MPAIFTIKVVPLVFLLAVIFTAMLNWPILLHFYDILTKLEHVKLGFVISIPIVLVAALNFVFMPFPALSVQAILRLAVCPQRHRQHHHAEISGAV